MNRLRYVLPYSAMMAAAASFALAAEEADVLLLDEIVVTAQRRAESLQDVPISLTVASGEQLENAGVARLEDISIVAPAVQLSRTGVYTQPAIRGVTTTLGGNYENNVGIYVDGYYLPFTRGLNMDLANIDQVQVLKGPQGTLFGRNATGGAVLIQTLDPSMSEASGRIRATYRRFDDRQVQGYFSTPVTQTLAWNVAGNYRKADSYIEDVAGFPTAPIENYSISTKFRWEPTSNLAISGKYESLRVSDGRTLAVTYSDRSLVERFTNAYLERRDNRTSLNYPVDNTTYQHTAAGKIEYDFGWGRLTSITAYQREANRLAYDLDGTKVRYFEQRTRDRNEALSSDLNLTSTGGGRLQYVVGFYFFDAEQNTLDTSSLTAASAPNFTPGQTSSSKTRAYAGYADVTYEVVPRLFLTGGIRYSDETKDLSVRCPVVSSSCPAAVMFDDDASFDGWTPRAVVRYELDDYSSVYASFSRGFKSGLINISPPFNVVDEEQIDAYEVGYKTARGRWRLDAAAYYYDYQDLQVSSMVIVNDNQTARVTNAASSEIYGAELQVSAQVTRDFNVNAGVAYTHARYKDFKNASANGTVTSGPTAGLNTTITQDWSGKRPTRAPDWTGNVAADYTLDTAAGTFVLAGSVSYTSSYVPVKGDLDEFGRYRYGQDAYSMINARVSWSPPTLEALTWTAFGENLGNSRYYFYRTGNAFGDYHVLGQPRTWGVSVDYRF